MTIEFLKELIENNARVILPEFGAFLVKDDGSGKFSPDNVSFSPFLRYNDGMLEDSLSKKFSISKDEAIKKVKEFVELVKEKLLNENFYPIQGIGSLYRDNRGSVLFTKSMEKPGIKPDEKTKATKPAEKAKATPASEAVKENEKEFKKEEAAPKVDVTPEKTSDSKPVEKEPQKVAPKVEPPKKTIPQPKPAAKPHKKVEPKVKPPKNDDGSGTGKAILIGSLIGIALVAIVVTGWYLYKNDFFSKEAKSEGIAQSQSDSTFSESVSFEEKSEIAEKEGEFDEEFEKLSESTENKAIEQKNEEATPQEPVLMQNMENEAAATSVQTNPNNIEAPLNQVPTSDGPFHLIVGSFRNIEYAEKFSADMKRSGYNSTVIVQASGMHAVTLGSYSTRQDALKAMDQFKMQHPNVWLLKTENE